ncbi:MAG: hypothetical protein JWN04_1745 [Myxococcaceae bacterium]|nr:hypothetical protein [Myxococcaceae bacterium]
MTMHRTRYVSAVGLLVTLASCARCSDEPRVPFKLHPQPEPTAPQASAPADAATPTARAFDAPLEKLAIGGLTVAITHVRATLEVDLDGDGARDVLALREDEAHKLQLLFALRESSAFAAPRAVTGFVEQDLTGCALDAPHFVPLSGTKAALSLALKCAEPATQSAPYSALSLLSLEAVPRVYERIDVIAPDADGQAALALSPHSVDADGDGHDDVGLTVTGSGAVEPDALELVYLDRPSGLVRDAREPEATLSAWAAAAQSQLIKAPEQAIARAELALTLQRAVCRELGSPVLALSGTPGVPCGTMKSTGALWVTLVSGYAKRGELRAAFDAYRGLRRAEPKPAERELEKASAALLKLPAEAGITLRRGPSVEPVRTPRMHLPSARFVGENTLYVHRLSPVLYDLERNEESAAPSTSDQLMRDPSGQLIATAVERTCEGHAVRIEHAPPRGSDYTASAPVASAVIAASPSAPGCTRSATRADDGGFTVLGWAPQGLLAARGSELRLVPLSSDGRASGPARALLPDAPRPAPLPSGSATADAARYVEATPFGILVYGPSSTHVELWRPEGYTAIARGPLEAAISPSARKVAAVIGSEVYLLERPSR